MWLTRRTKAAIHFVVLTERADVWDRAASHAWRATLFIHQVEGAHLSCKGNKGVICCIQNKLIDSSTFASGKWNEIKVIQFNFFFCVTAWMNILPQNWGVLQLGGWPPAWEHWRENSASVLQTQKSLVLLPHPHMSCTQAWVYGAGSTSDAQELQASEWITFSHIGR